MWLWTWLAGRGSCLVLHTVNGRLVARIECSDLIHCLTFSPAPEGQSVNVIAGGMSTSKIRFVITDNERDYILSAVSTSMM